MIPAHAYIAMDLAYPFQVYDRNDPDLQIHILGNIIGVIDKAAVQPLIEQQVCTLRYRLPRSKRTGRLMILSGLDLIMQVTPLLTGSSLRVLF